MQIDTHQSRSWSRNSIIVFLVACLFVSSRALAQAPTGTILGVVKDASGAVVPGATLTVHNTETGLTRTAVAASDGSYRFSVLPVGSYEVRAEQNGFQAEQRTGLTLAVGQEAVVNISLQVGQVQETVSVSAEAPLVTTTSGALGSLVNQQTVADLPLNGRNFMDLTALQPGITHHVALSNGPSTNGFWFSNNGAPMRSNNFLMDGTMMGSMTNATMAGADGSTLGVDGIREYRVVTNSQSAEYGMTMGAQVVVVSKGGTNQFHGSGFEYLRNSVLDARNYFNLKTASTPYRLPPYKRNQYGGSLGGPIKKDKTFFFVTYEALKQRLGVSPNGNAIPTACHALTNNPCATSSLIKDVPVGSVAPAIAPILAIFPFPNLPNNQFTFGFTQPTDDNYGQVRIDHNLSSNDALFGRFTIEDSQETDALAIPQITAPRESRNQYLTLSENHIFSGALLNTARASFSRTQSLSATSSPFIGPDFSYFPGRLMGSISISDKANPVTGFGPAASSPAPETQNVFSESDDMVYTRGPHTLKFGALFNHFQAFAGNGSSFQGSLNFNSLANFLDGNWNTESGNTPGSFVFRTYHYNSFGVYGQDDWRVNQRMTLNVGLRYEFITDPQEVSGHGANLVDLRNDAAPTLNVTFQNPSFKNFSPRFGFGWDITGDGKTALRGGFAELYDIASFGQSMVITSQGSPPYSTSSSATNNSVTPASFALPFTFTPDQVGKTLSLIDYNMSQPHILQWNFTMERQLPGSMLLSVSYAGSRGLNLPQSKEGNPTLPQGIPVNGVCTPSPTFVAFNPTGPKCYTGEAGVVTIQVPSSNGVGLVTYTGPQDPRTNPNWKAMGIKTSAGESTYNSLQIGLNKRMSHGLQYQMSFTWSKILDDTQGQASNENSGSSTTGTDPSNNKIDKSFADFDVPRNLHFNLIYQPPKMFASHKVLSGVLDGWRGSTILNLSDGEPFTPTVSGNISLSGGSDRPNLVAGRNNSNTTSGATAGCSGVTAGQKLGTQLVWFDPCAFYLQNFGFLGNAARNILRAPGITNLDLSLTKDFALKYLGEGGHIEFRAEAFNIMNTPNFAVPNRSVFTAPSTPVLGQAIAQPSVTANAGLIQSTNGSFLTSRQLQFGLRVVF